ncbi:unnamed protein product [Ixodes pacificus]
MAQGCATWWTHLLRHIYINSQQHFRSPCGSLNRYHMPLTSWEQRPTCTIHPHNYRIA